MSSVILCSSVRKRVKHLFGIFLSVALVTFALPSFGGVITIEFTSNVVNADGAHGPRDTEVTGVINFELLDLEDRDASPEIAEFADGQRVETDLGWATSFSVEFTSGRQAGQNVAGGSANLRIENSPQGDELRISTRSFTPGGVVGRGQLFDLGFSGGPDLFAGNAPVLENLASLEDFLLSFDSDQLTSGTIVSRLGVEDTLRIGSISISSVPEPGMLSLLGLALVLFRRRYFCNMPINLYRFRV